MKKKIETDVTITIKIEGNEFYLTKAEAEDLYTSLQDALGKNILKLTSPVDKHQDYYKKHPYAPHTIPPTYPPDQIWCKSNNNTQ